MQKPAMFLFTNWRRGEPQLSVFVCGTHVLDNARFTVLSVTEPRKIFWPRAHQSLSPALHKSSDNLPTYLPENSGTAYMRTRRSTREAECILVLTTIRYQLYDSINDSD